MKFYTPVQDTLINFIMIPLKKYDTSTQHSLLTLK